MRTLEELHPVTMTLYFLCVMGVPMFCTHPAVQGLCLAGALLYFLIRCGRKDLRMHLSLFLLFLVLALANPLLSHNGMTVLFVLNDNPVTLEAFLYGLNAAVMVIGILYWLRSFSQVMTSEKLLCVFGAVSPKIALILSMALRFIPLLRQQVQKVSDVQKTLGYYKQQSIPDSIREHLRVFDIVTTWAMENGIITANSMSARGLEAGRRTHFTIANFRRDDVCILLLTGILTAVSVSALLLHSLDFVFYPSVTIPEPSRLGTAGILTYAGLALFPSILQMEVHLHWKYLLSKI